MIVDQSLLRSLIANTCHTREEDSHGSYQYKYIKMYPNFVLLEQCLENFCRNNQWFCLYIISYWGCNKPLFYRPMSFIQPFRLCHTKIIINLKIKNFGLILLCFLCVVGCVCVVFSLESIP
jgi:hypothetical protein